jgi:endonuclease/exonuclease/phosphatase family metal-dependent hydrolase
VLAGILFVLRTGIPWEYLPKEMGCGSGMTCWRRLRDWNEAGIANKGPHRIIVAGDWNLMFGYGENGDEFWARRYATVFDRMKALGLRFLGPQEPNGRQAEPWPKELPKDSRNVPTFYHSKQKPAAATRQLDYVFLSESIADRVTARALNEVDAWGPSDHCRVVIDVADR